MDIPAKMRCGAKAVRRYTWPGQNESYICAEHLPKLRSITEAMGMYLQLIELPDDTHHTCQQYTSR